MDLVVADDLAGGPKHDDLTVVLWQGGSTRRTLPAGSDYR